MLFSDTPIKKPILNIFRLPLDLEIDRSKSARWTNDYVESR